MVEQIQEVAPPTQPEPVTTVPAQLPKKNNLLTIVIPACRQAGCLIAILLVGIGGVYAGIQIGKKQVMIKPSPVIPTIIPTQVLEPTTIPTQVPETTNIPTLDETANWKTYTNTRHGFEFKYPDTQFTKDHPVVESAMGCNNGDCANPEGYRFDLLKSCSTLDCNNWIMVEVFLNPNSKNYINQMNDFTGFLSNTKLIESNLGGLAAKKRVNLDGTDQAFEAQQFYVNNGRSAFIVYADLSDPQTYQILSTFKFTN